MISTASWPYRLMMKRLAADLPEPTSPYGNETSSALAWVINEGYASLEEWMEDSGYELDDDGETWLNEHGDPVDMMGTVEGAMESALEYD